MPENDNGRGCQYALTRRKLLRLAGSSTGLAVVCSGAAGCGNPTGSPPTGPVSGGSVSALEQGTLRVLGNVAVARDAGGVYGMSSVCTHAGCFLMAKDQTISGGLDCPCHESLFDGDGAVTHGPARQSLQHYLVTIATDGNITVNGDQPVPSSTRMSVT